MIFIKAIMVLSCFIGAIRASNIAVFPWLVLAATNCRPTLPCFLKFYFIYMLLQLGFQEMEQKLAAIT